MHHHSTNDMCCRCAPALAIDYSCDGGTGDLLHKLMNKHNQNIALQTSTIAPAETFVNFFASSRCEFEGYDAKTETPSRRYVNHDNHDQEGIDLLDLWKKRLVVQWMIPIGKIKPIPPLVMIEVDGEALDDAFSIFNSDEVASNVDDEG